MKKVILSLIWLSVSSATVYAQSDFKEGSNNFARYTKSNDFKNLEDAKKFADLIFKTRRDSANVKNNVLRGMVYSALAVADSTRKVKYVKDPIEEADLNLKYLVKRKADQNFDNQMSYMRQNMAAALAFKAKKLLASNKVGEALLQFKRIDSLGIRNNNLDYNIAASAMKSKAYPIAIDYYKKLVAGDSPTAQYYFELAEAYRLYKNNRQDELATLEKGFQLFPDNKALLFRLIDIYSSNGSYDAIIPVIDQAIKLEPENVDLKYLAGFSYENAKNIEKARSYYKDILIIDPNNYNANLALGLLDLKDLMNNKDNIDLQNDTEDYLLKANEVKPYEVNTLIALSKYYELINDVAQLDRVNLLLNQLTIK